MAGIPSGSRRAVSSILALGFAIVGAVSMLYYHVGIFMPRVEQARTARHLQGEYSFGNDLYPVWLTSRRWIREGLDPYSQELTREIQVGLFGRPLDGQYPTDPPNDYRTYAYPTFTNLLFWPLSEVPFHAMRIVWTGILALLLGVTVIFWTRALSWQVNVAGLAVIILLVVCSYPELEGLYAGQLGLWVGFLLAASLLALVRGRLLLAGIAMALTAIKPQMTLLAMFYLLLWSTQNWRERWRFTVGFAATLFLLIAASLAIWSHWIQSWVGVIRSYPSYSTPPLAREVLGSNLRSHGGSLIIALLLIAAALLAWGERKAVAGSQRFWFTLSLLLAITAVALLPGQSLYDHVILLPGIFLLAHPNLHRPGTPIFRALFAIGVAVLLWPYFAAFGLIVLRPLMSPEVFASEAVFVLPLRTAAAFPFVVLGLLTISFRATLRESLGSTPAANSLE
jgi:Glycosyltransferase family 87